jgi:hypothetical protein
MTAAVLGLFWLDPAFGVLATPVQPEMDRIANIAKIKRANGIALFPLELLSAACIHAPLNPR